MCRKKSNFIRIWLELAGQRKPPKLWSTLVRKMGIRIALFVFLPSFSWTVLILRLVVLAAACDRVKSNLSCSSLSANELRTLVTPAHAVLFEQRAGHH